MSAEAEPFDLEVSSSEALTIIETVSFMNPAFSLFCARNEGRLKDIVGPVVAEVLPHTGWHFTGEGVQLLLQRESDVIGLGWAMPVIAEDGSTRMNLTYAIDESETGKGHATLLASAAFLLAKERGIGAEMVSAQMLSANLASQRVAASLGMRMDPRLTFSCETSAGRRDYVGLQSDFEAFARRARQRLDRIVQDTSDAELPRARCAS